MEQLSKDNNYDENLIEFLNNEFEEKKHESSIRIIAKKIYDFFDKYHIELNPIERERLCLCLINYRDSKKAAAHIFPIKPSLRKIPHCADKIAKIIDDISEKILESEIMEQNEYFDDLLKDSLKKKPFFDVKSRDEIKSRKKKISKIQSFIIDNEIPNDEEDNNN